MHHANFKDGMVCVQESESNLCPGTGREPGTSVCGHVELDSTNTLSERESGFSLSLQIRARYGQHLDFGLLIP